MIVQKQQQQKKKSHLAVKENGNLKKLKNPVNLHFEGMFLTVCKLAYITWIHFVIPKNVKYFLYGISMQVLLCTILKSQSWLIWTFVNLIGERILLS